MALVGMREGDEQSSDESDKVQILEFASGEMQLNLLELQNVTKNLGDGDITLDWDPTTDSGSQIEIDGSGGLVMTPVIKVINQTPAE